jgi:NADH-quinone oxidoreductase subunit C
MTESPATLAELLRTILGDRAVVSESFAETTIEVEASRQIEVARVLRDDPALHFEQLMDLCGVDYLSYGQDEWDTEDVSSGGFSRGVEGEGAGRFRWADRPEAAMRVRRFAVVSHLLSIEHNRRVRLRVHAPDDELPIVPSLVDVWGAANWFEREAFDLFGILFEGHPDLRRILTDYGFVGHPFRKDFPLIGNVEVRYDPQRQRVIYEPVSIEPRVGVPRVIRDDSRYLQAHNEGQNEIAGKAG